MGKFITILLVVILGLSFVYTRATSFERTVTVSQTFQNVKSNGDSGSKHVYMMTDSEGNSYKISDSLWYWQWRSTDIWASLKEGQLYKVRGYGWRIGILSSYPNIIEAIPVGG